MLKIPYNKIELLLASISINSKMENDPEMQNKIEALIAKTTFKAENKMKEAAAFIGIPLETLVASPNMKELIEQFEDHKVTEVIHALQTEIGFTQKEAWTLLALAFDSSILE